MTKEWARFPDDILWRRSKLGLTMPPQDREALAAFMAKQSKSGRATRTIVVDDAANSHRSTVEPELIHR